MQNGIEIPWNKSLNDTGDRSVAQDLGKGGPKNTGVAKELARGGGCESYGRGSTGAGDAWKEFREAVDAGRWHLTRHVVECVGFDGVLCEVEEWGTATGENETVDGTESLKIFDLNSQKNNLKKMSGKRCGLISAGRIWSGYVERLRKEHWRCSILWILGFIAGVP